MYMRGRIERDKGRAAARKVVTSVEKSVRRKPVESQSDVDREATGALASHRHPSLSQR
jgi:hypothetical protein